MRCIFCQENIMNDNAEKGRPVTVPQKGIAHSNCAAKDLISRRVFKKLELRSLEMEDLHELKDMVLMELNERSGVNEGGMVELF